MAEGEGVLLHVVICAEIFRSRESHRRLRNCTLLRSPRTRYRVRKGKSFEHIFALTSHHRTQFPRVSSVIICLTIGLSRKDCHLTRVPDTYLRLTSNHLCYITFLYLLFYSHNIRQTQSMEPQSYIFNQRHLFWGTSSLLLNPFTERIWRLFSGLFNDAVSVHNT